MTLVIVEGEGAVLGVNLGHPIVIDEDFATQLSPNYFRQDLFFSREWWTYVNYSNKTSFSLFLL